MGICTVQGGQYCQRFAVADVCMYVNVFTSQLTFTFYVVEFNNYN